MSGSLLDSVFGALVILSPDKKEVLVVGQVSLLRKKQSLRFPGKTIENYEKVSPHLMALAERVVSLEGDAFERATRTQQFFEQCIVSAELQNWGSDVNTLILDDVEPHAKSFQCFVMTEEFDWNLVRKESTPKPSDDWFTDLLPPTLVPLTDIAQPPIEHSVPGAHQTVAQKLLEILQERVYCD
jgi:hypothetical protein